MEPAASTSLIEAAAVTCGSRVRVWLPLHRTVAL
jgi:hypothetical protein